MQRLSDDRRRAKLRLPVVRPNSGGAAKFGSTPAQRNRKARFARMSVDRTVSYLAATGDQAAWMARTMADRHKARQRALFELVLREAGLANIGDLMDFKP
jgi:hypothetical protein